MDRLLNDVEGKLLDVLEELLINGEIHGYTN